MLGYPDLPVSEGLNTHPAIQGTMPQQASEVKMMEVANYKEASSWTMTGSEVSRSHETVTESEGLARVRVGVNGNYVSLEVLASYAGNFQPNGVLLDQEEALKLVEALARKLRGVA